MFSSSSSVIVFLFVSSNNSSSSESYLVCSTCVSTRWLSSYVLSIGLIWSYGSSNQTEFTFGQLQAIVTLGGAVLYLSVCLLKSLGRDPFLWFLWRIYSLDAILFMKIFLWRDKSLVFHHVAFTILSLLCCWFHIQGRLISGTELMRSLIFDRIWVDTVDYCFCGCVDAALVYSGGEIYCQNSGWKWVQSWNRLLICVHLMFLEFQRLLQLWSGI